jgi:3-hydroxyacyl-CoA dehydrogenase
MLLEVGAFARLDHAAHERFEAGVKVGDFGTVHEADLHEPAASPRPIERAAIVGAGTMGTGIAMAFADAHIAVRVFDESRDALDRAHATIARTYASQLERGRIDAVERDVRIATIELSSDDGFATGADMAIEAVFEDPALKAEVFARLGRLLPSDALLATNTSTLDVDAIAAGAPHPERCLGMHFFSPANVMRLLEIVRGAKTSPAAVNAAVALGRRIGKIPVVVGNCDGFVGNRMLLGYRREAEFAVLAGAAPAQVDGALERFGFAMGPFAVADLAGIDVGWRAKMERIKRSAAPPFAVSDFPDALVAAGRLGQKAGKGWYRYVPGDRSRHDDPDVAALVATERSRSGIAPRTLGDDEIVERCVYALVNEGARILEEGVADSAADIDAIWVNGYGFPKAHGGPMQYADGVGLAKVAATIAAFAQTDPAFWRPAPLLVRLAESGGAFTR